MKKIIRCLPFLLLLLLLCGASVQAASDNPGKVTGCLVYTSDAADERSILDLGCSRIYINTDHVVGLVTPS